jgi:putative NADPH-quinone reductase
MSKQLKRKIVVINAHPSSTSFNQALMQAYIEAVPSDLKVEVIEIGKLHFDPNLKYGYEQRMELEPDLQAAWSKIMSADHLVWIFPVWWGGLPAVAKGFIDRLFLPSQAFSYFENSNRIRGHLKRKTARIITTLDQAGWTYKWYFGEPSTRQLKDTTLKFCGVGSVKTHYLGSIRGSSLAQRQIWLGLMKELAQRDYANLMKKSDQGLVQRLRLYFSH